MIKKISYLVFLTIFCFIMPSIVKADYTAKFVSSGTCSLKLSSTGNCFYKDTTFNTLVSGTYWLDTGDEVTVITSHTPVAAPTSGNGSECSTTYSYVKLVYKNANYYGYACTDNIKVATLTDELKKEFQEAGFPESYWESLSVLKEAHPTWQFIAIPTNLDFQTAVQNEDSGNKSLIQSTSSPTEGYLSTKSENYDWNTDTFHVYDGTNWYAANQETIAYYMDPRNFLSDMYIFQFNSLSYNKEEQPLEVVSTILGDAYISKFADYFMKAAETWSINPVYLASLSIQEVGTTASLAVSGSSFTYNGITYSGYYNFYNIGATSGSGGSTVRGLAYAAGVKDGKTTFGRPWNTEEKAILGGAQFMAEDYVQLGQNTSYFKKWNTSYKYSISQGITNAPSNYSHQYMQNIMAPSSEAQRTYSSYSKLGLLDYPFIFYIPVYNNMPEKTSLPNKGNPNNYLKNITVNGTTISGFSSSKTSYQMYVTNDVESMKVSAATINSGASVSGTGTISLKEGENTISLVVKAQNGDKKTYTIVVTRETQNEDTPIVYPTVSEIMSSTSYMIQGEYIHNFTLTSKVTDFKEEITKISPTAKVVVKTGSKEKTTGSLATSDTIQITSGEDTVTYTVVIYGDINGDGSINALDLLKVQKHILHSSNLVGAEKEAADINKDSNVNALDLLKVQKHILGNTLISQK